MKAQKACIEKRNYLGGCLHRTRLKNITPSSGRGSGFGGRGFCCLQPLQIPIVSHPVLPPPQIASLLVNVAGSQALALRPSTGWCLPSAGAPSSCQAANGLYGIFATLRTGSMHVMLVVRASGLGPEGCQGSLLFLLQLRKGTCLTGLALCSHSASCTMTM